MSFLWFFKSKIIIQINSDWFSSCSVMSLPHKTSDKFSDDDPQPEEDEAPPPPHCTPGRRWSSLILLLTSNQCQNSSRSPWAHLKISLICCSSAAAACHCRFRSESVENVLRMNQHVTPGLLWRPAEEHQWAGGGRQGHCSWQMSLLYTILPCKES